MLTPNIAGMSKPKSSKSISTAIPTNGAAKNPKANKRKGNSTVRIRICFCEISTPANTPHKIRLIAETHHIKMSNSLPSTLRSLRNHKDKTKIKTQVHVQNSFVKLKVSPTDTPSANYLKLRRPKTSEPKRKKVCHFDSPIFQPGHLNSF
jgi:hypothetical protein